MHWQKIITRILLAYMQAISNDRIVINIRVASTMSRVMDYHLPGKQEAGRLLRELVAR
jgi:hypothetical protein